MATSLSPLLARVVLWLRGRVAPGDAGTSLMELVVGMAIMVVFMGMFTGAMLMMSNTTNNVEALTTTTTQATDGFLRLDREMRYATAISTPKYDSTSKMWHVEFSATNITQTGSSATSSTVCTQLAIDPTSGTGSTPGQLKQRSWVVGGTPGAWTPIESSIKAPSATNAPFVVPASVSNGGSSTTMQQLTITLTAAVANPGSAATVSSYTFTALNSSTSTDLTQVCQQFAVGATS